MLCQGHLLHPFFAGLPKFAAVTKNWFLSVVAFQKGYLAVATHWAIRLYLTCILYGTTGPPYAVGVAKLSNLVRTCHGSIWDI